MYCISSYTTVYEYTISYYYSNGRSDAVPSELAVNDLFVIPANSFPIDLVEDKSCPPTNSPPSLVSEAGGTLSYPSFPWNSSTCKIYSFSS